MTAKPTDGLPYTIKDIPLDQLVPSPNNPRKFFDPKKLEELAESIGSPVGQLVSILCRPMKGKVNTFEILDGERRYRAAILAKVTALQAKIIDVTDAVALEITVICNLQRADVTPLEEANGVASLLAAGRKVEDIAADLGKSTAWVYLRAKLKDLSPKWNKAVDTEGGDHFQRPASFLELIARFPVPMQDEMLVHYSVRRSSSVAELQAAISEHFLRQLKSAPWDIADGKLVTKAGACNACPKRSSCQQNLFAEEKDDTCLDSSCWSQKHHAHLLVAVAAIKKEHPSAIMIVDGHPDRGSLPEKLVSKAEHSWNYSRAKAGDKGAVPAIYLNGNRPGVLVHVKKGTSYGESREASTGKKGEPKKVPLKERLAVFMKRRARGEISAILEAIGGRGDATSPNHWGQVKPAPAGTKRPTRTEMMALACAFGIRGHLDYNGATGWAAAGKLLKDDEGADNQLWAKVRQAVCNQLIADKQFRGDNQGAKVIAPIIGRDWKAIVAEVRDKTPLPRTLAEHFLEDGTPRTGVTAAKKPAKAKAAKSKKSGAA